MGRGGHCRRWLWIIVAPSLQQLLSKWNYRRSKGMGWVTLTSSTATSIWCCSMHTLQKGPWIRNTSLTPIGRGFLLSLLRKEHYGHKYLLFLSPSPHSFHPVGRKWLIWLVNGKSPSIGTYLPEQEYYSKSWGSLLFSPSCMLFSLDLHILRTNESTSLHPASKDQTVLWSLLFSFTAFIRLNELHQLTTRGLGRGKANSLA